MERTDKKMLFGAGTLAIGAFIAKVIGALYRIPLTNILGSEGLGIYQTVFPAYAILLDFSGAGAPNALAKIISGKKTGRARFAENTLACGKNLFGKIGVICSLLLIACAYPFAILQGNPDAVLSYVFLSPAVFFAGLTAVYRGYFQGRLDMRPTAVSQVIEQLVKLLVGVLLVKIFSSSLPLAVGGATLGVTVSEIIAFLYLLVKYERSRKKLGITFSADKSSYPEIKKEIVRYALPVTLLSLTAPLSSFIDSFTVVNVIGRYSSEATSLFGLYSGTATTIINLPVSLCYGFSAVAVPSVSGAGTEEERKKRADAVMLLTMLFALPCAICTALLADRAVGIIFPRLSSTEKDVTVFLIKILSANVVFLSLLQTENAVLVGKGKAYIPLVTTLVCVAIKTALGIILMSNPYFNVFGIALATIACYFIASLVNLIIISGFGIRYGNSLGKNRRCDGEN